MPWEVAGGFTAGTQTASIALEALRVKEGETLLVHGTAAVQLARLGACSAVIGTASEANQNYVRELGATVVVYRDGLKLRVEAPRRGGSTSALVSKSGRSAARLTEAAAGHREIGTGHGRGKIVLTFP
ncbi:hypothetical protein [Amycolatopsis sp. NBC_00438]|uniref:hypothetical protein n=1 Tax=Amycolatopsis sp. NBC_00438 TaxID=2903558 RepID=UPI002E218A69